MFGFWSFLILGCAAVGGAIASPFIIKWIDDIRRDEDLERVRRKAGRLPKAFKTKCCGQLTTTESLPHIVDFKQFIRIEYRESHLPENLATELKVLTDIRNGHSPKYSLTVDLPVLYGEETGLDSVVVLHTTHIRIPFSTCQTIDGSEQILRDFKEYEFRSCPARSYYEVGPIKKWGRYQTFENTLIHMDDAPGDTTQILPVLFMGRSQVGKTRFLEGIFPTGQRVGNGSDSITFMTKTYSVANFRLIDTVGLFDTKLPRIEDIDKPLWRTVKDLALSGVTKNRNLALVLVSRDEIGDDFPDSYILSELRALFNEPSDVVHLIWDGENLDSIRLWLRLADGTSQRLAFDPRKPLGLLQSIQDLRIYGTTWVDQVKPDQEEHKRLLGIGERIYKIIDSGFDLVHDDVSVTTSTDIVDTNEQALYEQAGKSRSVRVKKSNIVQYRSVKVENWLRGVDPKFDWTPNKKLDYWSSSNSYETAKSFYDTLKQAKFQKVGQVKLICKCIEEIEDLKTSLVDKWGDETLNSRDYRVSNLDRLRRMAADFDSLPKCVQEHPDCPITIDDVKRRITILELINTAHEKACPYPNNCLRHGQLTENLKGTGEIRINPAFCYPRTRAKKYQFTWDNTKFTYRTNDSDISSNSSESEVEEREHERPIVESMPPDFCFGFSRARWLRGFAAFEHQGLFVLAIADEKLPKPLPWLPLHYQYIKVAGWTVVGWPSDAPWWRYTAEPAKVDELPDELVEVISTRLATSVR